MEDTAATEALTSEVLLALENFSESEVIEAIASLPDEVRGESVDLKEAHRRIADALWMEIYPEEPTESIEEPDTGAREKDGPGSDMPIPAEGGTYDMKEPDEGEAADRVTSPKAVAAQSALRLLFNMEFVRRYLCPALRSASDDAFDIAKVLTPLLGSLSLAGVVALSLDPLIFAALSLLIARMGVASLCAEKEDPERATDGLGTGAVVEKNDT